MYMEYHSTIISISLTQQDWTQSKLPQMRLQSGAQEPNRRAGRTNANGAHQHTGLAQHVLHRRSRLAGVSFGRMLGQHARRQHGRDEQTRTEHGERQEVAADRIECTTHHGTNDEAEPEEGFEGGLKVTI